MKQTEELFKNGRITHGSGRGKALVDGTAFAGGSSGSGGWGRPGTGSSSSKKKSSSSKSSSSSSSSNPSSPSSSKSDEEAKEFEETLDWIEVKIDRIERAVSRLDLKASSVFKTWGTRSQALVDQIAKVGEEIEIQEAGAQRYLQQANSVGLSEDWAKKVRDGKIDIEKITDEDLNDKISQYKDWYDKYLDCIDAAEELKETESELYKQRFDNAATEYDGIIGLLEHEKNLLDEFISQSEARAYLISAKYYEALSENERGNVKLLQAEKGELIDSLGEALASGTIKENSEAYVEMLTKINEVTEAIEEGNTALLEYAHTIDELKWEQFDVLQERINHITEETEFFINLMSNKQLYDDKGQFSGEGMATAGLYAVNYNTNMHQADMYGAEAKRLEAQLASDPNNRDLEKRYHEMLGLQREHILNAEDEKNAIRDLVEDGIGLELDYLDDLIEKRNEALDASKDMYDFNKKVAEQTKEISRLEKERSAYEGDDSEETRSKIQEIKVSLEEAKADLEETEYEKMIADQEKLLDTLYDSYSLILNQRLDNIDLLLSQIIDSVNINSSTINDTLNAAADKVGTELSAHMNTIWGSGATNNVTDVITMYNNNFSNTMTTTLAAINGIKAYTDTVKKKLDDEAAAKAAQAAAAKAAAEKAARAKAAQAAAARAAQQKAAAPKSSGGGDGVPRVGDRVKFVSGNYYNDSYGSRPYGHQHQGEYVYITKINASGSNPYHISTGNRLGNGDLGWLKLNQLSGYASGKKKILDDQIAWTQENGDEMIVRPSDGAVLTPLAKGDSVLNANASSNIWDMANSPSDFIRESLGIGDIDAPSGSGAQTSISQNFGQIVFSMPNVRNYEQMLAQMQKDRNFERLVNSFTIDQIAGKSSLRKGKAIR